MEGGFIEMTQPDSPNSPKQKDRLTRREKWCFWKMGVMG
ncbi:Fic family protein [Methanospirillum stamsii]